MHSYAADPEGARKRQAEQVLRGIGAIAEDGRVKLCSKNSREVLAVQSVFPRVLRAAREEVASLMAELEKKMERDGPQQGDSKQMERLQRARAQLEGWKDDGFLVVDVNTPNAFVHALVPRLIFVHRGLFWTDRLRHPSDVEGNLASLVVGARVAVKSAGGRLVSAEVVRLEEGAESVAVRLGDGAVQCVATGDLRLVERRDGVVESHEQLAMLLGHELSHVIHDHAEGMATALGVAAGCQLVLLALLDPTGLLSFLAEAGMAMTATYGFRLPRSRANELQADSTGLQICARALYDPRDAATFFSRMLDAEAAHGEAAKAPGWASTHPKTEDRLLALRASEEEAVGIFERGKARSSSWRGR